MGKIGKETYVHELLRAFMEIYEPRPKRGSPVPTRYPGSDITVIGNEFVTDTGKQYPTDKYSSFEGTKKVYVYDRPYLSTMGIAPHDTYTSSKEVWRGLSRFFIRKKSEHSIVLLLSPEKHPVTAIQATSFLKGSATQRYLLNHFVQNRENLLTPFAIYVHNHPNIPDIPREKLSSPGKNEESLVESYMFSSSQDEAANKTMVETLGVAKVTLLASYVWTRHSCYKMGATSDWRELYLHDDIFIPVIEKIMKNNEGVAGKILR
jgi:hypothetical protein